MARKPWPFKAGDEWAKSLSMKPGLLSPACITNQNLFRIQDL